MSTLRKDANSTLSGARRGSTFALQMLRDQQRRLELAERMKSLREESPYTQQAIADQIGLQLRSYQKAEQTGGISYDRLQKLAALHGVDFDWLLKGESRGATPDLLGSDSQNGIAGRLERIEVALNALLDFARRVDPEGAAEALETAQMAEATRIAEAAAERHVESVARRTAKTTRAGSG